MRIAINGLGRIGKLVIRAFVDEGLDADIVLLNDVAGDAAVHAHLPEFDTVHGRWDADPSAPTRTQSPLAAAVSGLPGKQR